MYLVFYWVWNRELRSPTPNGEWARCFLWWDWNQIFLFTLAHKKSLGLDLSLRRWQVTERSSHADLFNSSISLKYKWHMTRCSRRQWIWRPVPRHIFICLKTSLLLCQRRSSLVLTFVPSLRSFINQPSEMNNHCWAMLSYSLPHHPKVPLKNLLVHLSLHSWESQRSFLNGNWLVNLVSLAPFLEI